ncbi:hypothetical protein [Glaciibacter psychrotolerans]|uniref:Uncharacterized protein n=1 Tax=Glaciibacter psychrotolerans TaxID=670054 RepID=A0A7Z0EAZ4_9MICO|nr:hypothetical protein [Leifsonia psychrotolerans]NYJ18311.1 hypothetical protein [Leifsonia psychrotolerans]
MALPKPIRFDLDTWLCMRTDPALPKAVIQRVHGTDGSDRYLLFKWDLDPKKRVLMGVHESLDKANDLVRFDTGNPGPDLPPGMRADGPR